MLSARCTDLCMVVTKHRSQCIACWGQCNGIAVKQISLLGNFLFTKQILFTKHYKNISSSTRMDILADKHIFLVSISAKYLYENRTQGLIGSWLDITITNRDQIQRAS